MNPFKNQTENVKTSPKISDEVKQTTCYMCACRCGIDVHLLDNQIIINVLLTFVVKTIYSVSTGHLMVTTQ